MAIKPKGKKVTGTKKKDKITWTNSKPWKTNLTVKAGAGNDVINFSKSSSKYKHKIYGEAGKDVIKGGKGKDIIDGGAGNDKIYGNAGNDVLKAGKGNDYIDGGAGNDKIYGQYGTNKLKGGTGKDIIYAGTGTDNIWGGKDDDIIYANKGVNVVNISKGDGNDKIRGVASSKKLTLNLGTGLANVIAYKSGSNVVFERKYSDTYSEYTTLENFNYDTTKDKVFVNYNGKSVSLSSVYIPNYDPVKFVFKQLGDGGELYDAGASSKSQIVYGGAGNDTIITASGDNILKGGAGDDSIIGGTGADDIDGGDGDDIITAGVGNDTINAGEGSNSIFFNEGDGSDTILSGGGSDTIRFNVDRGTFSQTKVGNDLVMSYASGSDNVILKDFFNDYHSAKYVSFSNRPDPVSITDFSISIYGSGDGQIEGSKYTDIIYGSDGVDVITAGETQGDNYDTIRAGKGNDEIHIQENGNANIKIDYSDGDDVIYGASSANSIRLDISGSGIRGYQDGNDYVIVRKINENAVSQIRLKDYQFAEDKEDVTIYIRNKGFQPLRQIDLGENYVPGMEIEELTETTSSYDFSENDNPHYIIGNKNSSNIKTGSGDDYINAGAGLSKSVESSGGNNRIIANGSSSNKVTTGSGNDTISTTGASVIDAGDGNNIVMTGDGNDSITTGSGNDSINTGEGKSTIHGGDGDNTITTGNSDDYIYTGNGDDIINTGNGYNYVSITGGKNSITGGNGIDIIQTGDGDDTINAGGGNNQITISGGSNTVNTGSGNDTITISGSGENHVSVVGGANKITMNTTGNSTITGGTGEDRVNLTGGNNEFTSGGGDDKVTISGGANNIDMSSAARDTITITDGTNDITATAGNNSYIISDGTNTVTLTDNDNGYLDYANISGGDNTFDIAGHKFNATINGGENDITTSGDYIDTITIYNGTNEISTGGGDDKISIDSVEGGNTSNNTIYGGAGGDSITATYGNNVIYAGSKPTDGNPYAYTDNERNSITLGVGTNIVYGGSQGDSITSTHVGEQYGTSSIYGGAGDDRIDMSLLNSTRIVAGGGDDSITSALNESYIDAGEGDDTIKIVGLTSTVIGGAGNDSITVNTISSEGDQTVDITAGSGNNEINLINLAAETIHFKNDGSNDVISETHYTGSSKEDTLVFDNSHLDELYASLESYGGDKHLIITYNNGADTVKILNFLNNENDIVSDISKIKTLDDTISISDFLNSRSIVDLVSPDGENGVYYDGIVFAESITGTEFNDTLNGGGGNDTIYGGAGNDSIWDSQGYNTIVGGTGNDTISLSAADGTNGNTLIFTAGDGFDIVEMNGNDYFDTASTLKFNISSSDIKLEFGKYNNNYGLFIRYGVNPNDKVFLKNFTNREAENIKIATLSGETTLVDLMAQKHVIGNFTQSDSTLSGSTGNDYLYTGKDYNTDTTVTGGKGNDVMTALSDTEGVHYVFNIDGSGFGDGNDIIYSVETSPYYKSSIDFTGVGTGTDDYNSQSDFIDSLECYYEGNDLIINYGKQNASNPRSSITIKNYKTGSNIDRFRFVYGNETITYDFANNLYITNYMTSNNYADTIGQNDLIYGTEGNDTISAGSGNNRIDPDDGADTIIISGTGTDRIYMGAGETADMLWFKDIESKNDLTVSKEGNDFKIIVGDTGKTVLLKNYFLYAGPENPTQYMDVKTGENGTSASFKLSDIYTRNNIYNTEVKSQNIEGTVFNDSIYASDVTAEEIFAGDGNDRIIMEENNSLTDTQADIIHLGTGNDTINYNYADNDGIEIYGDAGNDSITMYSGKAVGGGGSDNITVNPNSDKSVTIYGGTENSLGRNSLGVLEERAADQDILIGGSGDDYIYGGVGADSIEGKAGNDSINGRMGADIIQGGAGMDTIDGGAGNDSIYSHTIERKGYQDGFKSVLYGGNGNDTIYANAAYNIISGDGGNDSIIAHDNTINEYHFKKGNGADVVKSSKYWNGGQGSYKDVIIFDDMDFTTDGIQANLDIESGTVTISYGAAGNLTNTITIDNYVSVTGSSVSYVSSIDKLIDKNGKTIRLTTLCETPANFVTSGDKGTVFSDNIVPADYRWMYSNGGNDTITGVTGQNNALYAAAYYSYALDRKDWSVEGNCYLDGKSGANILVGGMGNDTVKGGYDLNTDNIYGGFGANTYIVGAPRTDSTVANIYSASDKDTLQLGVSSIYQSFNRNGNDLQIIQTNSGTNDTITLKNWYQNPVDMTVALSNGTYNLFELMADKNYTMGVQYGTKSNAGICLGTSGNDVISVGAIGIAHGGAGNDTFNFTLGSGNVTIYGGDGNDTINGASKNISFTVFGGDGADTIKTGNYADTIFTGSRQFRYDSNGSEFTVEDALSTYQVDYVDLYSRYGVIDNFVEAGAGNDTIVSFGENASLNGGTGNDTYHVLDINNTVITDSSGTNTLTIHDWGNSGSTPKFVVMNVDYMDSFKINSENNFEIFILNEDSYRNWMVNSGKNTTGFGGVRLTSNSAGNLINTVSTIDTQYMTLNTNNINTLKSDVASWLSSNGFESVQDALKTEQGYYGLNQIFSDFASSGWEMKN